MAEDVAVAEENAGLNLKVDIKDVGPCKKHISVTVSEADIQQLREETVADLSRGTAVPGFRAGKVPEKLLAKRFRKEISDQLKQKLLLQSLEQVSEEHDLDPINEPELDVENLEVPESGDFDYEFEVEVRPVFELPEYSNVTIRRPVREISEEDVAQARERYLAGFGQVVPYDGAVEAGDYVVCNVEFTHNGEVIREFDEITLRVRPKLSFWDAEVDGFEELMVGAKADDVREIDLKISREATDVEMRDETVHAKFTVLDVKRMELPELDDAMLERIGAESKEKLDELLKDSLTRQVSYEQRQKTREQVLEKITESASWDLPEGLVRKHVDNALRREILEMQQAGFSRQQIMARENQLRQQSLSVTQQALKEHFVLDRIGTKEDIECTNEDISMEITYMAMQQGESPRKLRARLIKSGMIENLEAQIRERKAVDFILSKATFEDEPMESFLDESVETVNRSITSNINDVPQDVEGGEDE
ncbi:trigger factor [Rubinisphaera margarita]|uniref:trigger factor n=1 Tax=Rubinisphaera margarita TaxID=2909586 RepID=UPI001EE7BAEA|nr:trigger factor [Rubinisphaera margarita]MCG6157792.1 trigger factor [Rubinisphaera margarita]